MRVTMVRCIFLVFFMVITTISSYGQNEEQKMMGEAKLKEESLRLVIHCLMHSTMS